MTYAGNEWQLAVNTTNNGGETLTVVFGQICPAAVLVEADDAGSGDEGGEGQVPGGEGGEEQKPGDSPETGDDSNPLLWAGICIAAVAGVGALVFFSKNKKEDKEEEK